MTDWQRLLLGCHLVYDNAVELTDDATLLLERKRFARAYFLAHVASEELAKVPLLLTTAYAVEVEGAEVDWKLLRGRLSDHPQKLEALAYLDDAAVPDAEQFAKARSMIRALGNGRNSALYSEIGQNLMGKPSALGWSDLALRVIQVALARMQFIQEHGLTDDALLKAGFVASKTSPLTELAEKLIDAGVEPLTRPGT